MLYLGIFRKPLITKERKACFFGKLYYEKTPFDYIVLHSVEQQFKLK